MGIKLRNLKEIILIKWKLPKKGWALFTCLHKCIRVQSILFECCCGRTLFCTGCWVWNTELGRPTSHAIPAWWHCLSTWAWGDKFLETFCSCLCTDWRKCFCSCEMLEFFRKDQRYVKCPGDFDDCRNSCLAPNLNSKGLILIYTCHQFVVCL